MKRVVAMMMAVGMAGASFAPAPARAVVYAQEVTQLMVLAKEIESVINTVRQLEYMARTVSSLNMNTAADVITGMTQVRSMLGSISPAIESINASDSLFRRCWPEEFLIGIGQRELVGKIRQWRQVIEGVTQESWRVQAAAVNQQQSTAVRVGNLVAASQAAPGQTTAIQAGNQLIASLSGQIATMTSTMVAHQRAVETVMAADASDIDRQRALGEDVTRDSPGWARVNQQKGN